MPLTKDPSEIEIVTLFRARCKIMCPGVAVVAIPNAAKRSQWAARQAKREGLATGFPDIMCIWQGGEICFIEFKTARGKLSPAQEEWLERLSDRSFRATVARSADEALDFLRQCGAAFIGRIAA